MTNAMAMKQSREMTSACQIRRCQREHVCTAWYGQVKDALAALATE
jgi:hypothetical protein